MDHGYLPSLWRLCALHLHLHLHRRVLYLAVSPDGQTIVTGAGDETLRFWNVFPGSKAGGAPGSSGGSGGSVGSLMRTMIR